MEIRSGKEGLVGEGHHGVADVSGRSGSRKKDVHLAKDRGGSLKQDLHLATREFFSVTERGEAFRALMMGDAYRR